MTARDWLIDGASGATTSVEVLSGMCERLVEAGVPLARVETYVRTLHPQVAGRAFLWTPGRGCRVFEASFGDSPAQNVSRARMRADGSTPYLAELQRLGMAEVFALPLTFLNGEVHGIAFATTTSFSDADIAALESVIAPLSRMAEILALRRTAENVIAAYVGRDAAARVLAGQIRRGDTELIEAAIWFSDMRGFSTTSNDMAPRDVIAMLNDLFDCQVPAIEKHGGEVLKFMGDGLLAIFTPGHGGMRDCCARALAASRDALHLLDERNARAASPIRFGTALHVGEVAYGNIGGAWRLDFTCIGRAVNLAARLESLTGKTGHDVLASEAFAAQCDGMTRIGEYEVKGFATPIAAFVPAVRPS